MQILLSMRLGKRFCYKSFPTVYLSNLLRIQKENIPKTVVPVAVNTFSSQQQVHDLFISFVRSTDFMLNF